MCKKLVIIGASGHGKVIADIARKNGYGEILFLDDNRQLESCGGYPVAGVCSDFRNYDCDLFVGIGNAKIRRKFQEMLLSEHKSVATLIHPDAVISENVSIGQGTAVMAGAVINANARIGSGCIINTCASVDHDDQVGDYVHISVGAHLAGTVTVGDDTWVGIGAAVSNNISICENCMIGAGAVVVRDLKESGTYVGVPAGKLR